MLNPICWDLESAIKMLLYESKVCCKVCCALVAGARMKILGPK